MTVKELIEILQQLPEDMRVTCYESEWEFWGWEDCDPDVNMSIDEGGLEIGGTSLWQFRSGRTVTEWLQGKPSRREQEEAKRIEEKTRIRELIERKKEALRKEINGNP